MQFDFVSVVGLTEVMAGTILYFSS